MGEATQRDAEAAKLEWIAIDSVPQRGSRQHRMKKLKENPFVPIGCLVTGIILGVGVSSMTWTDKRWSNWLMRARIASQAVTVGAILAGSYFAARKQGGSSA